jgi:hypothetical protein
VVALKTVEEQTRKVAESIDALYAGIALQGQIGERQEDAIMAVIQELRASRNQARDDGMTIRRLTLTPRRCRNNTGDDEPASSIARDVIRDRVTDRAVRSTVSRQAGSRS